MTVLITRKSTSYAVVCSFALLFACGGSPVDGEGAPPGSAAHSLAGKTMYAQSPSGDRFANWTFYAGGSGIYSKPQTGSPAQTNAPFNWTYDDSTGRFIISNSHGTDTAGSVITLIWDTGSSGHADESGYGTLFTFTLATGGAPPTPTTGEIAVWTSRTTTPSGTISVRIDGAAAGTLTTYSKGAPTCGDSGTVTKTLAPGSHSVSAADGALSWGPTSVVITAGGCVTYQLQ